MTELIDIKTRIKTKAPPDEKDVSVEEFFKELTSDLTKVRGAVVVVWDEDGAPAYSHVNASWAEVLWYAHHLAQYATDDNYEEDDE